MSGQAKHTPGPWRVDESDPLSVIADIAAADGGGTWEVAFVCASCGANDTGTADPDDQTESFANAEFIVRAANCHADLLVALETALELFEQETYDPADIDAFTWRHIARVAIARAKGA